MTVCRRRDRWDGPWYVRGDRRSPCIRNRAWSEPLRRPRAAQVCVSGSTCKVRPQPISRRCKGIPTRPQEVGMLIPPKLAFIHLALIDEIRAGLVNGDGAELAA